jgi:hypothetical protein
MATIIAGEIRGARILGQVLRPHPTAKPVGQSRWPRRFRVTKQRGTAGTPGTSLRGVYTPAYGYGIVDAPVALTTP